MSTPLKCGFSPSELLMSRKLRTNLPTTRDSLRPAVPDLSLVRRREEQMRQQAEQNYNRRHGARDLEPLSPGQTVWIPDRQEEAEGLQEAGTRSYEVQTSDGGVYRRNRRALVEIPNSDSFNPNVMTETNLNTTETNPNESNQNTSDIADQPQRSTRQSQPPNRYEPSWRT